MFGGLGLKVQPDGYLMRNNLEGSINEKVMGAVKYIFEGGFKFAASDAKN